MILAFLRAEYHSPRFKTLIRKALGGDATPIYRPKLDDAAQNAVRKQALAAVRGYGLGNYLFQGFPADVEWVVIAMTRDDVGNLLYANYATWTALSDGSRTVRDGAANIDVIEADEDANANIRAVARELEAGREYPEMIVVAETSDAAHVLVEGHTRATAYFLTLPPNGEVEVIAGYSPTVSGWAFY